MGQWQKVKIEDRDRDDPVFLELSNPSAPLPTRSICLLEDILNSTEVTAIHEELDSRMDDEATWEGFDGPRRRVQRYEFIGDETRDDSTPPSLLLLHQKLKNFTGLHATHVKVEVYTPKYHKSAGEEYDPTILSKLSSYKQANTCLCQMSQEDSDCTCFMVEIPLLLPNNDVTENGGNLPSHAVQCWNQPLIRQDMCWKIRSPESWTDVRLPFNSALVKRGDMLSEWRSSRLLSTNDCLHQIRVIKMYNLKHEQRPGEDDTFGYKPNAHEDMERAARQNQPMPPLADLLSIIVTTSPIKSNPSTEVLEKALETFKMGGSTFAFQCPKVFVCDGFRTHTNEMRNGEAMVSKKHTNTKQAMRNGIVDTKQAANYLEFKRNLRKLCSDESKAVGESVFNNATVVELDERWGYGFALRYALRNSISTPYVCVVQHDRTFMRPTPVHECVHAMWNRANIKYIGFSMRSNLMYRDIFLAKYGGGINREQQREWNSMVEHPSELQVPATEYGPDSASSKDMVTTTDKLRKNILALAETYKGSGQAALSKQSQDRSDDFQQKHQMTLVPTLFWYDNIHICETAHYRDFIFNPSYKMVARGGFVEDKTSPVLKRTVERLGLQEGHSRFGCYLLDDHSGLFFTGHLDGGSYMTAEERQVVRASQTRKSQTS